MSAVNLWFIIVAAVNPITALCILALLKLVRLLARLPSIKQLETVLFVCEMLFFHFSKPADRSMWKFVMSVAFTTITNMFTLIFQKGYWKDFARFIDQYGYKSIRTFTTIVPSLFSWINAIAALKTEWKLINGLVVLLSSGCLGVACWQAWKVETGRRQRESRAHLD